MKTKAPKNIIMPGDQFAPKGTTEWADWQRSRLKHALKDVHFEARQIVEVITNMCEGGTPAWHLMTRHDGKGFRTFKEFVTHPEGLQYPDYDKFRGIAISEPGIMNEREYDLLTTAPAMSKAECGAEAAQPDSGCAAGHTRITQLRAIRRAPPLIQEIYGKGLINAELAELLGPDEKAPRYTERKAKADKALVQIQAIHQNGDNTHYRQEVNKVVREVFAKQPPTTLEKLQKLWQQATDEEKRAFRALIKGK